MPRSRSPYICTSCGLCSSGDPDTPRLGRPGKRRVGRRKADGGAWGPVGGTGERQTRGLQGRGGLRDAVVVDTRPRASVQTRGTGDARSDPAVGWALWVHRRGPRGGRRWDGLCACQGTEPEGQRRAAPRLFLGTWGAVRSEVFFFFLFHAAAFGHRVMDVSMGPMTGGQPRCWGQASGGPG